jgi:ATP-dependent RNA helicase DHX8/PRP22
MEKKIQSDEFLQEFRKSLPIYQHREQILSTIKTNLFSIITGDTGSGKTTQIPQFIMESLTISDLFRTQDDNMINKDKLSEIPRIVITQPRRVATIQMAKRVSFETKKKLGDEVGYSIRFEDCSNEKTVVKYVTDGILVRECLADHNLSKYNIIILDEAHERSLYTDILFALVKQAVLRRNNDLRLIITSATLDTKQFSSYFNECPVYSIQGRCYPVDVIYHTSRMEKRVENSVKIAIRIHLHEGPGHILVFLTGFEECEQACKICYQKLEELVKKGKTVAPMLIMPLYGAQNTEEQSQVFEKAPENCRKLIFSTNIAETSLTVDGIGYVIDCGYVKQKIFNPRTSMDSLMIVPISKVQAIQRTGRAGRTGPGKCIRLYSEQFFDSQMNKVTVPEILRVNLTTTILTLKSMGIENVVEFEFMEKPERDAILQALKQLYFLQAIDRDGKITRLGHEMSKFPLDVCYSRALISSQFFNVIEEINTLVSLISCESVWYNVNKYDEERRANFDEKRLEFIDKFSDHMTFLNIYKEWEFNKYSEEWCKSNFLHHRALKQSRNIKEQLKDYINKVNFKECEKFFNLRNIDSLRKELEANTDLNDYDKVNCLIRMSLCQGFFMNSARKIPNVNDGTYLRVCDGSVVTIDTYSSINLKTMKPELVIYTELGGSNNKAVMKQVSIIELKWINDLVHLLKNVDITRLRGADRTPIKANNSNLMSTFNDVDLYSVLEKPIISLEEQQKEEENLKLKAEQAKERYLKRKTLKNK